MSDFDVRTSLVDAGFPPEHWETFLTWERELLAHLAAEPVERPATVLLDTLVATGLGNGLDEDAALAVVCHMWSDIESWRTPPAEPEAPPACAGGGQLMARSVPAQ